MERAHGERKTCTHIRFTALHAETPRRESVTSARDPLYDAAMSSDVQNATIIHRQDLTDQLGIIRIQPDSGPVAAFEPGQFVMLGLPRDEETSVDPAGLVTPAAERAGLRGPRTRLIRRAYSICSSAAERGYLEFFLVLIDYGDLTPRLWVLDVGGRVWMDAQARGKFALPQTLAERNVLFVATGTGVAPFVSMLRTFAGRGRWRRCALIHGVRYATDFGYDAELRALAASDPSFRFVPICSREPVADQGSTTPPAGWGGLRGRVQVVLESPAFERHCGFALDAVQCDVFLCGNPGMIESVRDLLTTQGFRTPTRETPGNLHFERYW
jgi:ferredoxin--NADP+ reductase